VRNFAPLADALHALSEFPPQSDPAEVWLMQLSRPRKVALAKMLRRYFRSFFPSLSLRPDEALRDEVKSSRATHSFVVSGPIHGRHRDLRLRVLHPNLDLSGSVLNFDPARIRAWYEDGLRTARRAHVAEAGRTLTAT
jgi:hypothetical protein